MKLPEELAYHGQTELALELIDRMLSWGSAASARGGEVEAENLPELRVVAWRILAQVTGSRFNFDEVGTKFANMRSNKGLRCWRPPQAEDRCNIVRCPARPRIAPHKKTSRRRVASGR